MRITYGFCFAALCAALMFAGCGGGGGGGTPTAPAQEGIVVQGTVTAPSGAAQSRAAERSAAAVGLVAKANTAVSAYRITDAGAKTGSTLATATTDINGQYSFRLLVGVSAASNLVAAVGSGNNLMRAFVVSATVNVNPIAELVVARITARDEPLSNFSISEIAAIQTQVAADAADIDLSGAATAAEAVALLDAALAENIDGLIDEAAGNDPPAAVTLSAPSGATASSLNLSWTQNADADFASYKIYRSTSAGVSQTSTLVDTITTKATTTKTVTGLSAGTTFYFKVYVCDTGSLCTGSNEVSGTTTTPTNDPPAAVTLSAPSGATASSLNLSWTQNADADFASYKIYRSTSAGVSQTSTLVDTITTKATTTKTVTGLSAGTTYYFKVYVCDTGALCTGSNEVSGSTTTPSDTLQSISVTPTSVSVQAGNTSNLTATCTWSVSGQGACPTLTWTSTNTSAATVSSQGVVTGVGAGSATVRASASGVNSNNVSVTVTSGGGDPGDNEWITIPAGNFVMGCADADGSCHTSESPKHTVTLSAYKIQKYEVTNAQYKACVDASMCTIPSNYNSYTRTPYYGNATYNNYPVIKVDWYQASAYCAWIGGRLPTEAEWEKAARGPSPREVIYPWGNTSSTCSLANYSGCVGDTSEIGSYPSGASYYEVMDMAGNVFEWVKDFDDLTYYTTGGPPWIDPQGPETSPQPGEEWRVLKGGSWAHNSWSSRVSSRYSECADMPELQDVGFRCAQD